MQHDNPHGTQCAAESVAEARREIERLNELDRLPEATNAEYVTVPSLTQPGKTIRLSPKVQRILRRQFLLAKMRVALERLEAELGGLRLTWTGVGAQPAGRLKPRRKTSGATWKSMRLWDDRPSEKAGAGRRVGRQDPRAGG